MEVKASYRSMIEIENDAEAVRNVRRYTVFVVVLSYCPFLSSNKHLRDRQWYLLALNPSVRPLSDTQAGNIEAGVEKLGLNVQSSERRKLRDDNVS